MSQVNENIDIVDDFFDRYRNILGARVSGSCVVNLLTGGSLLGGHLHFERVDRTATPCSGSTTYYGCAYPGSVVVQLAQQFVKAVFNSRAAHTRSSSGDGDCSCAVAELAAVIVHETCHVCLLDEIPAYLLYAHYKYEFARAHGFTSSCCTGRRVTAWDEAVWTESSAQAVGEIPTISQSTGQWRLDTC